MAITLKVNPDELKSKAAEIKTSIGTVQTAFNEIEKLVAGSKKYWEGDASDRHQQYYKTFEEDIPKVIKRLKDHPENLLTMANLYESTETKNEQLTHKLPDNVIS